MENSRRGAQNNFLKRSSVFGWPFFFFQIRAVAVAAVVFVGFQTESLAMLTARSPDQRLMGVYGVLVSSVVMILPCSARMIWFW